jgi:Raf kinase inhibitor-like YbhB/YbcL family protein
MWGARCVAAACLAVLAGCGSGGAEDGAADRLAGQAIPAGLTVRSPAFADGGAIPAPFTCEGDGVSPRLAWTGVPQGAAGLAVVVDDPDAPGGTYVHWVLHGLDPTLNGLAQGAVPSGALQAETSAGEAAYTGPCPPEDDGPHRYRFAVYALGAPVGGRDTGEVLDGIRANAIAKGLLTGTFER